MKHFTKIVQKMPFSGKFIIKELAFSVISSSTPEESLKNLAICCLFLLAYVYLHGAQCAMGIKLAVYGGNAVQVIIGLIYALVNFCVTLSQAYLIFRISKIAWRNRGKYRRLGDKHGISFSDKERLIATIFTLGGQIIFLVTYLHCF